MTKLGPGRNSGRRDGDKRGDKRHRDTNVENLDTLDGFLDHVDDRVARGWAWQPRRPEEPVAVDLYIDDVLVGSKTAAMYRGDLEAAGKGTGRYGFEFRMPPGLADGLSHEIRACFSPTTRDLKRSPQKVTAPIRSGRTYRSQPGQLVVLEPGLELPDVGHEASACQEILVASSELGIPCQVLASESFRPRDRAQEGVIPFFEADKYVYFDCLDDFLGERATLKSEVERDYSRLQLVPGTKLFCNGPSPWHLSGLADALQEVEGVSLAIGLMLSPSLWTSDPELRDVLEAMTWEAIDAMSHLSPYLFSETGSARRRGHSVPLPICVGPTSDATLAKCARLAHVGTRIPYDVLSFGFFGAPRDNKGVRRILEAATIAGLEPAEARITFFLPPEYAGRASELEAASDAVRVEVGPFRNDDYLSTMSEVTAVLCTYDREMYSDQMSGIVAEAAALGQPVIVTADTSLHRFLERFAPGAAVPVDDDPQSLARVLASTTDFWAARKRDALNGLTSAHEAKSFRRLFEAGFGEGGDPRRSGSTCATQLPSELIRSESSPGLTGMD